MSHERSNNKIIGFIHAFCSSDNSAVISFGATDRVRGMKNREIADSM